MAKITWDDTGSRYYETGVEKTVLYPQASGGTYPNGVAWNGVTSITESPSGAEATAIYADDIKYLTLMSNEDYGLTIECYQTPEEFDACDGTKQLAEGVVIGQQPRQAFGLSYINIIGNDVSDSAGYYLHLVYGCKASPSDRSHETINESPEASTLSYEVNTTPVNVEGYKPTAHIRINSTKVAAAKLSALEAILYGDDTSEARLPLPAEIISLIGAA